MNLDIWNDSPDLKERIAKIIEHQRQLQELLGIEPLTIEQRAERYRIRKEQEAKEEAEKQKRLAELAKFSSIKKPPVLPKIKTYK